jgi:hypothetical protein
MCHGTGQAHKCKGSETLGDFAEVTNPLGRS